MVGGILGRTDQSSYQDKRNHHNCKNKHIAAERWVSAQGEIEEFGFFLNSISGYGISKGEATDAYRRISMFQPYIIAEVQEIIPFEQGRAISKAVSQAQIAAAKKWTSHYTYLSFLSKTLCCKIVVSEKEG